LRRGRALPEEKTAYQKEGTQAMGKWEFLESLPHTRPPEPVDPAVCLPSLWKVKLLMGRKLCETSRRKRGEGIPEKNFRSAERGVFNMIDQKKARETWN